MEIRTEIGKVIRFAGGFVLVKCESCTHFVHYSDMPDHFSVGDEMLVHTKGTQRIGVERSKEWATILQFKTRDV